MLVADEVFSRMLSAALLSCFACLLRLSAICFSRVCVSVLLDFGLDLVEVSVRVFSSRLICGLWCFGSVISTDSGSTFGTLTVSFGGSGSRNFSVIGLLWA